MTYTEDDVPEELPLADSPAPIPARPESFLQMPYADRRFIVIGEEPTVPSWEIDPTSVSPMVGLNAFKLARAHPAIAVAAAAGVGAVRAWQYFDVARKKKAAVRYIGQDVASLLVFPSGPPAPGVVHVGHPRFADVYVPVNNFNLYLLQDRVEESLNLLQDLGATRVEIEALDHETASDFRLSLELPLAVKGMKAGDGNADATINMSEENEIIRMWSTTEPQPISYQPEKYLWLANEPTLMAIVNQRLARQIEEEHRIVMRSRKDFSVGPSVAARFLKANHQIGGEFKRQSSGRMSLHVQFAKTA